MTDIEQKALALIAEIRAEQGQLSSTPAPDYLTMRAALIRAIERHKTDIADLQAEYEEVCKLHEAFRQEVSDAIVFALKVYGGHRTALDPLRRFIIAKPLNPLAQAWLEAWPGMPEKDAIEEAGLLLATVEKCGGKIVWGEG